MLLVEPAEIIEAFCSSTDFGAIMDKFVERHQDKILGTLTCFDRMIFRGHLPLRYPSAVQGYLYHKGILYKDLKAFLVKQADRLKAHAQSIA